MLKLECSSEHVHIYIYIYIKYKKSNKHFVFNKTYLIEIQLNLSENMHESKIKLSVWGQLFTWQLWNWNASLEYFGIPNPFPPYNVKFQQFSHARESVGSQKGKAQAQGPQVEEQGYIMIWGISWNFTIVWQRKQKYMPSKLTFHINCKVLLLSWFGPWKGCIQQRWDGALCDWVVASLKIILLIWGVEYKKGNDDIEIDRYTKRGLAQFFYLLHNTAS